MILTGPDTILKGSEFTFQAEYIFYHSITGEHSITKPLKLKWYGAFNILMDIFLITTDYYIQEANTQDPYRAIISNSLSQQSGSRIYQNLSDYIYTAGGDLNLYFQLFGQNKH